MYPLTIGILAHVDAGKTTLSEGLLYCCGSIKKLGRVDHQNAFLDSASLERERGITIFSKQARLQYDDMDITLLDTPGHMDFSTEMERSLQVLDYAILVISGSAGVQSHTQTVWKLLAHYHIPTFLFINKMDLPGTDKSTILAGLAKELDPACIDFSEPDSSEFFEQAALCDDLALSRYLETGCLQDQELGDLIQNRKLFPCFFGAALKLEGVEPFLAGLSRYTAPKRYPESFGAKVYKISRDPQGNRLTWLKLTGGHIGVKTPMDTGLETPEKIEQIRLYSGEKYQSVPQVFSGTVCAVTGLTASYPGQGLGHEAKHTAPTLEPVMTYQLILPPEQDLHKALPLLRQLEEEDPTLGLTFDETLGEIRVHLMGDIQLEVLQRLIAQRFQMEVTFGPGAVLYKETIAQEVEGVGHFEPLGHYAEVHLLLTPTEPDSGLRFAANCDDELLPPQWQRLILAHLQEKTHRGVLTGAPLTDVSITLVSGKAHQKHTQGGDFREATYRAVRQGLKSAQSVLLEPWYKLRLELPAQSVGRAMNDIQQMGGSLSSPEIEGDLAFLEGSAPVSSLVHYQSQLASYTKGLGQLLCSLEGYRPCPNPDAVIAEKHYSSEEDAANPSGSIFCKQGAGFFVPWDQVLDYMHLPSILEKPPAPTNPHPKRPAAPPPLSSLELDKELMEIYQRTYGPIRTRDFTPQETVAKREASKTTTPSYSEPGPEYLLVDGYNIIHAWDELKDLASENLDAARKRLMDLLCNYQGLKQCTLILVFDAYKVPGGMGSISQYHNIHVVFTKEAETADAYIEKTTYALGKRHRVRVATSDNTEQLIILGHGALRLSAKAFHEELRQVEQQMQTLMRQQNRGNRSQAMETAMKAALSSKEPSE